MGTVEAFPVRVAPADPPRVDARTLAECRAAVALAELAGEPLEAMSADRFADYRRRAVVAMLLGQPDGRRLCAYLLDHALGRECRYLAELEHHLTEAIDALAGFDDDAVRQHAAALDQAAVQDAR